MESRSNERLSFLLLSNVILSACEGSHTARRELTRFSPFFIPNRMVDMTALSIWGPYALRRSVNKFSSSALGKINKFLLLSFVRQFAVGLFSTATRHR